MQLSAQRINNTQILVLPTLEKEPWHRVYGATNRAIPGSWVFPGYYPLGYWAMKDLEMLTGHWKTPLSMDPEAEKVFRTLKSVHAFYERANKQFEEKKTVDLPLPAGWKFHKNEPYNHQRFGAAVALTWWRHFYLWEMGTGKTKTLVEALRLLRAMKAFKRGLVLCPAIVIPTWGREVAVHTDGELTTYHWRSSDEYKVERAQKADVVLVTYQTARIEAQRALEARQKLKLDDEREKLMKAGRKVDFPELSQAERIALRAKIEDPLVALEIDTIIGDESQNAASWESQQTRATLARSENVPRRFLLSGTAADQPMKLYPQLRFLAPGLMPMDYQKFLSTHVVFHPEKKFMVMHYKGMNGLNARVNSVSSRMKKADCVDLPEQVCCDIPFTLGIQQKARYNEVVRTMSVTTKPLINLALTKEDGSKAEIVADADGLSAAEIEVLMEMPHGAARLGKLLQVSSGFIIKGPDVTICDSCPKLGYCAEEKIKPYTKHCTVVQTPPPREIIRDFENPKIMVFEDLLEQLMENDETNKVLCWANHMPELDDMEEVCKRRKWGHIRIDGSTTKHIGKMEERFQNDKDCRVSIGIVSAGVGITLTAANYAIYYALPWNRVHYRQSLDRNNRPGQTRKMTVYRLLGVGTVEPTVAQVLHRKEILAATLTDKIDCKACPHEARCKGLSITPFAKGCIYQPNADRPVAQVTEVL